MAYTEWGMSWCRLARILVTSTIDQVALLKIVLHLRIEERSSYTKIKEVRMKSSKCEGGCFMSLKPNLYDRTTNCDYTDQWVDPSMTNGGGGGGSVDVVSVVAVKLKGTSADAVRALKKFVLCRVSIKI
ncbi:hypothetical protein Tco_0223840 [Tanacetum coccineum]